MNSNENIAPNTLIEFNVSPLDCDLAIVSIDNFGTAGTMNKLVMEQYGYPIDKLPNPKELFEGYTLVQDGKKPILFIVTVGEELTIELLEKNLLNAILKNDRFFSGKKIWLPLLGTGAGGLSFHDSFSVTNNVLKQLAPYLSPDIQFVISLPDNQSARNFFKSLNNGGLNENAPLNSESNIEPPTSSSDFANQAPPPVSQTSTSGDPEISKVQADLKKLGFYKGEINGIADGATNLAVIHFQRIFSSEAPRNLNAKIIDLISIKADDSFLIYYNDENIYPKWFFWFYDSVTTTSVEFINKDAREFKYGFELKEGEENIEINTIRIGAIFFVYPVLIDKISHALRVKNISKTDDKTEIIFTVLKRYDQEYSLENLTKLNRSINNSHHSTLSTLINNDLQPLDLFTPFNDVDLNGLLPHLSWGEIKSQPDIKSRLISDAPDLDEADILGYDLIVDNLYNIMADEATSPPLNIGIMAPWGRGKTTLMKRLQKKFDSERKKTIKEINKDAGIGDKIVHSLYKIDVLKKWLKTDSFGIAYNLSFPTVWFNPWNYQSSDMIWAGLANAVIEQVVAQIPDPVEREIFWLQLHLARIDKNEIRKDLQIRSVLYISQFIIWGLVLISIIIFLLIDRKALAGGVFGVGSIIGTIATMSSKIKPVSKSISEAFDKYSKAPQYTKNLGNFHEVQADLNRVLELCVDPQKPLVVFVDDLDRCSPSKVVEVIEAINVFINGQFNNRCYFVIGMDGEMVAAALDVSYEKLKGRLGSKESEQGSVGWYFLDKFIQLPFFIPVMTETKKKLFLENMLSEKKTDAVTDASVKQPEKKQIDTVKVKAAANSMIQAATPAESKSILHDSNFSEDERNEVRKEILRTQVKSVEQNEEIKKQVALYSPYLSSDPRSLKRFVNLLRFHCSYQFLRMKEEQPYVGAEILSKWLAITVKFPQMVRWIQWDAENKTGMDSTAEAKSQFMDELLISFLQSHSKPTEPEAFTVWLQFNLPVSFFQTAQPVKIADLTDISWLKSRNMYRLLTFQTSDEAKFSNALSCNVW